MKIITRSHHRTIISEEHRFTHRDISGAGSLAFVFTMKDGEPVFNAPIGLINYLRCVLGPALTPCAFDFDGEDFMPTLDVIDNGVITHTNICWVPAVGECECGRRLELRNFTNTCTCGADYNGSGQRLAPRHMWGEETGEHWTECV